jgi:two-component system sensor kinase FixL
LTGLDPSSSDDRASDRRFRLGAEGAGIGGWDLDLSTMELIWSNTARKLFGVSDDVPITYELFLSLLDSGDRARTEKAISRVTESGDPFDIAYRLNRNDGGDHWVRLRAASPISPASSATSPNTSRPRRACRNCSRSSSTCHA